jgi:hypothetical protein
MSQDNSALIAVPFHGTTLALVDHNGEPYAALRPIVEGMGMAWQGQHFKLTANRDRWGVTEIVTPSTGGPQKTLCMPVRKLPAFFATIHPNKVAPALRATILAYQAECDDALWAYWTQGQATRPGTGRLSTEEAAPALPPPPADPCADPQVRSAINRKAHALSLRHYDRLREDLTAAVRDHAERCPDDLDLVRYVEAVDTPACELVPIHRADLWSVCAAVAAMSEVHRHALERIHQLEQITGRTWYGRGAVAQP